MTYEGKWYSNLFGLPNEFALVLKSKEVSGVDIILNAIVVTQGNKIKVYIDYAFRNSQLRLPLKTFDLQKAPGSPSAPHKMIIALFKSADVLKVLKAR